jgi:hypothetical protein
MAQSKFFLPGRTKFPIRLDHSQNLRMRAAKKVFNKQGQGSCQEGPFSGGLGVKKKKQLVAQAAA